MKKDFTYSIKTMGCKANIYDSMLIEKEMSDLGGTRSDAKPDVFILNSCTVTHEADKQAHYQVNYQKKRSPDSYTIVTGCYAEVADEKLRENKNIELTITNQSKNQLKYKVAEKLGIGLPQTDILADDGVYWGELPIEKGKTRAFLKIQEGCNDYCTYCIIPYARGKSRSVKLGSILSEINRLTSLGIQEIILTGTNIGDYGKDFESTLEDLIEAIFDKTNLKRLRLTSLDPSEITPRILRLIGAGSNHRLMPHFHVSLQSPVSRVLRGMKRDYRTEEVISCLESIAAHDKNIYVGMDVIAGFPGESADEHQEAVSILEKLPWNRLHVFPYSEREGTPATKIKDKVPVQERRNRAQELINLSSLRHRDFAAKWIGKQVDDILFESVHESEEGLYILGHSPNYLRILAKLPGLDRTAADLIHNTIGSAHIESIVPKPSQDWTLESTYVPSMLH